MIDFVLTWVDGNDKDWQKEYLKHKGDKQVNFAHYRDWNTLKYWFRAVEKYAPWVRKIHFVTCGQTPEWLNTDNEKINIVNHNNYIDDKYLPTFSANPIELNFHKIKDLSEKFVYFNDDTFITAPVNENDFFIDDLPCDSVAFSSLIPSVKNEVITYIIFNDLLLINSNFIKNKCIKENFKKYFSLKYGKQILRNLYYLPIGKFSGFVNPHLPNSFLKATFEDVWNKEYEYLDNVCKNKFRSKEDVNQYLMRYWQIATGKFIPRNQRIGNCVTVDCDKNYLSDIITKQKYKLLCINDCPDIDNIEYYMNNIIEIFEKQFPQKSSFEK